MALTEPAVTWQTCGGGPRGLRPLGLAAILI